MESSSASLSQAAPRLAPQGAPTPDKSHSMKHVDVYAGHLLKSCACGFQWRAFVQVRDVRGALSGTLHTAGSAVTGSVPSAAPTADASAGCHLCCWPSGVRSEAPTAPSGWMDLLEQLTELRRPVYLLNSRRVTKDVEGHRQTNEETHRERSGRAPAFGAWGLGPGTRMLSGSPVWRFSESPSF